MPTIEVSPIEVAVFDVAGTTVNDMIKPPWSEKEIPSIIAVYIEAFRTEGVELSPNELHPYRGKDKILVFEELVAKHFQTLPEEEQKRLARKLHDEQSVPALIRNIQYLREMPGASETFRFLKERGIYVALGTGHATPVAEAYYTYFGWPKEGLVDFVTWSEKAGGGRPAPNMINQALVAAGKLPQGIDLSKVQPGFNYGTVLKGGDSLEDVKEGNTVGALTVALTSGTQTVEQLVSARPKVVLPSVAAIPNYLSNHGYLRK